MLDEKQDNGSEASKLLREISERRTSDTLSHTFLIRVDKMGKFPFSKFPYLDSL